jgi:hypothetical protein
VESSASDLKEALFVVARFTQSKHFAGDIRTLQSEDFCPRSSPLLRLNPYLDEKGVLQVDGRLHNARLEGDCKHPIILTCKHQFAKLIVVSYHNKYFHSGIALTCNLIRQTFWFVGGFRSFVRKTLRDCVKCKRWSPRPQSRQPLTGALL